MLFFISGCATTKKTSDLDERLFALEAKMNSIEQNQANAEDRLSGLEVVSSRQAEAAREAISISPDKKPANPCIKLTKKDIQLALKNAGYYNGPIDGKLGSGTIKSLKKFQKENRLKANGKINKETRNKLSAYLK